MVDYFPINNSIIDQNDHHYPRIITEKNLIVKCSVSNFIHVFP